MDWYTCMENTVSEQIPMIPARERKYLRLKRFLPMARRIDELAAGCRVCMDKKELIEYHATRLEGLVGGHAAEKYRYFEDTDAVLKHLRFQHHIYLKGFFPLSYSMGGCIAGLMVAALLHLVLTTFTPFSASLQIISLALSGATAGGLAGIMREKKLKKEHRILSL